MGKLWDDLTNSDDSVRGYEDGFKAGQAGKNKNYWRSGLSVKAAIHGRAATESYSREYDRGHLDGQRSRKAKEFVSNQHLSTTNHTAMSKDDIIDLLDDLKNAIDDFREKVTDGMEDLRNRMEEIEDTELFTRTIEELNEDGMEEIERAFDTMGEALDNMERLTGATIEKIEDL